MPRGKTLLLAADFGGSHQGQLFDTYSFLILDIDRNYDWQQGQRDFRKSVLRDSRRMAFKSLNDKQRREALLPFLHLADCIDGWLVTFAVSKAGGSLFIANDESDSSEELALWKPHIRERLMRVVHLSAFLMSGLSVPDQNIFWMIDQDAIAANTPQLTQLTKLVALVASQMIGHNLGHLRCGTTHSDDGTRWLEDLASISDLACGSVGEALTSMNGDHTKLLSRIMSPVPKSLSWKSRVMTSWQAQDGGRLERVTCLIDLSTTGPSMKISIINWHAVPGLILVPVKL